jgi:hypothetical protein
MKTNDGNSMWEDSCLINFVILIPPLFIFGIYKSEKLKPTQKLVFSIAYSLACVFILWLLFYN